tara:strand:- start:2802 stop:3020 length:219 start_codon:yes stop_codon:yes gene_type:complete
MENRLIDKIKAKANAKVTAKAKLYKHKNISKSETNRMENKLSPNQLIELGIMLRDGLLTREEFELQKKIIIG